MAIIVSKRTGTVGDQIAFLGRRRERTMDHNCLKEVRNSWGPGHISMKKEKQNNCLKEDRNSWVPGRISMKKKGQYNRS